MSAQQGEAVLATASASVAEAARPDRLTLTAFALVVLLGGANAVSVRFSNAELSPFWGAALRFALTALLFWAILFAQRLPVPGGRALLGAATYGALNFGLGYAFVYWGLVEVQAGVGQVIISLAPLMTFFFALAHRQERFRWRGLIGAMVAVGGIALAFAEQLSANVPLLPLLALVVGTACWAESGVLLKQFPGIHPVTSNASGMSVGAAVLLVLSLLVGEPWSIPAEPATWAALAYLVLMGSLVVFYLVVFVLKRWTASASSYGFVLLPFVAVPLSALLQGESVTVVFLLGGALVLLGVWIGALRREA